MPIKKNTETRVIKVQEAVIVSDNSSERKDGAKKGDDEASSQDKFEKFVKENPDADYNKWFAFFQKFNARELIDSAQWMAEELPSDGYAAYKRWLDIFENPSKMEKITKAQMEDSRSIDLEMLAIGDDDEAYYVGIIKEISQQMNGSGISPQEFARLSANMLVARKELREIRSRKPKKGTVLDRVMNAAEKGPKRTAEAAKTTPVVKKTTTLKSATGAKDKKTKSKSSKAKK